MSIFYGDDEGYNNVQNKLTNKHMSKETFKIQKNNFKYSISNKRPYLLNRLKINNHKELKSACDKYNLGLMGSSVMTSSIGFAKYMGGVPRKEISILDFYLPYKK